MSSLLIGAANAARSVPSRRIASAVAAGLSLAAVTVAAGCGTPKAPTPVNDPTFLATNPKTATTKAPAASTGGGGGGGGGGGKSDKGGKSGSGDGSGGNSKSDKQHKGNHDNGGNSTPALNLPSSGPSTSPPVVTGPHTTRHLVADPGGALAFDLNGLWAPPGRVTITLRNPSSDKHAIAIAGESDSGVDVHVSSDDIKPGRSGSVTASLPAGQYEFYCPIDDHRAAGMTGILTIGKLPPSVR